jgi:Protein of unknown function DUF262
MKTSATNKRIRELLTGIKDQTIVPRPEFQRRLVWTNRHKQEFIKTVLQEYPFPEIYVATGDVNPDTAEGTQMLVDGQQRISTLYQYFTGSPDIRLGEVPAYSSLQQETKLAFLEYEVVVRDLGKKTIDEIKEVFTRINSTKYSLNAMEIHNARFDGAFKQFGEALAGHEFFERHGVFKSNDIKRMGDLVFCLALVITLLSTYFNRDDDLEEYLDKYNDEFPGAEKIQMELSAVFDFVTSLQLEVNSRAWRKAELLNLLAEVHRQMIKDSAALDPAKVRSDLVTLYDRVNAVGAGGTDVDEVTGYYKAAIQATNDRSNRITRGTVVGKVLKQGITF